MTMRDLGITLLCSFALAIVPGVVSAQTPVGSAPGRAIFTSYCASCHGPAARGDGPLASALNKRPADLTLIARRNGGIFDADLVARIIDGRRPVKGHGGGDMPAWGDAFAKTGSATPAEEQIRRLVAYLESVQVKP